MYGIGHVLSKIVFHETPESFMAQSFRADYMIKLDTTFKFHETKFHRVVWALVGVQKIRNFTVLLLSSRESKKVTCELHLHKAAER